MSDQPLTFEQFLLRRNNFALHFAGEANEPHHLMGGIYRKRGTYVRCMEHDPEFPAIEADLRGIVDQDLPEARLRRLYEAYVHMRAYVEVNEWKELLD